MSREKGYASIPERITWTPLVGFSCGTDHYVLGKLATFANFRTGQQADMDIDTLVARCRLPKRTVQEALKRLARDGWITRRMRRKHHTVYHIRVDRLATHWIPTLNTAPKIGATGDTYPQIDAMDGKIGATGGANREIGATGCAGIRRSLEVPEIPCTDPQRARATERPPREGAYLFGPEGRAQADAAAHAEEDRRAEERAARLQAELRQRRGS